ncbi:MAG: urease accessory protein [Acidimicrobiaceae bacterium]|jgi:urease accessory protein|nr:urease accessory protein [Acidimicrobiaceae bacterium]
MNGGLEVRVEGTRVVRLVTTPPIAAKVLPGPVGPVLMLVGSAAGLLTGDRLRIWIDLAPGSRLEVRTTAATIAHPCRDGETTALDVECHVGAGAQLVWLPEPLIACAGCRHHGRARVRLERGARAVWLDTLTLGRTGESAGPVEQRLDVELEGRPLLREGLRLGTEPGNAGPPGWDGPAVVGGHRHVAALHLLGRRLPEDSPGTMPLAGPGTTARFLAHRGDELARKVGAVLPRFLQSCRDPSEPVGPDAARAARAGERLQEAVQV